MTRRGVIATPLFALAAMAHAGDREEQLAVYRGKWKTSKIDEIVISVRADKLQMTIRGIDHPRPAEVDAEGTVSWMGQKGRVHGDKLTWTNGDVWERMPDDE